MIFSAYHAAKLRSGLNTLKSKGWKLKLELHNSRARIGFYRLHDKNINKWIKETSIPSWFSAINANFAVTSSGTITLKQGKLTRIREWAA